MITQVAPQNAVICITILPESLPAEGAVAGGPFDLAVEIQTEDGAPLDADTAAAGLRLRLLPPGGEGAGDAMVLAPLAPAAPEGATRRSRKGDKNGCAATFTFRAEQLTAAGRCGFQRRRSSHCTLT